MVFIAFFIFLLTCEGGITIEFKWFCGPSTSWRLHHWGNERFDQADTNLHELSRKKETKNGNDCARAWKDTRERNGNDHSHGWRYFNNYFRERSIYIIMMRGKKFVGVSYVWAKLKLIIPQTNNKLFINYSGRHKVSLNCCN